MPTTNFLPHPFRRRRLDEYVQFLKVSVSDFAEANNIRNDFSLDDEFFLEVSAGFCSSEFVN
jgi:hypothetical protein